MVLCDLLCPLQFFYTKGWKFSATCSNIFLMFTNNVCSGFFILYILCRVCQLLGALFNIEFITFRQQTYCMHVMKWTTDLFWTRLFFVVRFMLYKSTNTFNSDLLDALAFLLVILLNSILHMDCHCMFARCQFLILCLFFFCMFSFQLLLIVVFSFWVSFFCLLMLLISYCNIGVSSSRIVLILGPFLFIDSCFGPLISLNIHRLWKFWIILTQVQTVVFYFYLDTLTAAHSVTKILLKLVGF